MKIYFLRHGQTAWNKIKRIQGSIDVELSKLGEQQADELGNELLCKKIELSKIYTSTQKRAIRTAEIIAGKLAIPVVESDRIREINLGDWEGKTWEEVERQYYQQFYNWLNKRRFTIPPGGESYQKLLERVVPEIELIIQMNTKDIAIVTHSAVIMCVRCLVDNTAFEKMDQYKIDNLDIYEFDERLLDQVKQRLFMR
ncbi:MAG: histidine phosphatase family protein [Aerococcaceae bacterium]|nr:histidine phosphatase family protein [Aerococcaceae bacterium]